MPLYKDAGEDTRPWIERVWRRLLALSNTDYDHMKVTDFLQEVARGNVAGAALFGAYGERSAASGEVNRVIWPNGVFLLPSASGVQMTLSSTSASDSAAGTGIRTVEIHYLDANLAEQAEIVTLNGLTGVNTVATDIRFIQCMHGVTFGTGAKAAGTISAINGGVTYSQIATGDVRCASSARMVPAGKRAYVAGAVGSSISGTSAAKAKIRIVASEIFGFQFTSPLVLVPFGSVGIQDGSEAMTFPAAIPFSAGTVIAMTESVDKNAEVGGTWFGWTETL